MRIWPFHAFQGFSSFTWINSTEPLFGCRQFLTMQEDSWAWRCTWSGKGYLHLDKRLREAKKKQHKVLPGGEDLVRQQQKWLGKEGMTARWEAPAQRALFSVLRKPRDLPFLSCPTAQCSCHAPPLQKDTSTLLILICLILPFYSHVTNMYLTSFIEMHFWSPKIQTDSVPSVFSLLLNPLRCGRNLSHTYCNLWHCQHESPGPVVLGKLSLPYLLFCLCLSTHPVAARRRQPQRTRQQFLRDNTVLSFFLQHQISREAAGGVFWDLSQLLPTPSCFPKLLHSFHFIPFSPFYLPLPTIRKTEVLEC